MGAAIAPHFAHLPLWVDIFVVAVFLWRANLTLSGRRLPSRWLLSAVVTGTPYSVVTQEGSISALGTVFLSKALDQETAVCICHGKIALTGAFGRKEIASSYHEGWSFTSRRAPAAERGGTLEGHEDEDVASLKAFLPAQLSAR